jgi:hypothetical protein
VLPGAAYGFTELRRNGWRGLQHDGAERDFETRLVLVPEAKSAYFIVVEGKPGAEFWHSLDEGFFDRLFPPRNARHKQLRERHQGQRSKSRSRIL